MKKFSITTDIAASQTGVVYGAISYLRSEWAQGAQRESGISD
jgi:hypothetical protein